VPPRSHDSKPCESLVPEASDRCHKARDLCANFMMLWRLLEFCLFLTLRESSLLAFSHSDADGFILLVASNWADWDIF
jgi:hypothetical protein